MLTSKLNTRLKKQTINWINILLVLIIVGVGTIWFMQKSINAYWQQTYHSDSVLSQLDDYKWWQTGQTAQEIGKEYSNQLTETAVNLGKKWDNYWGIASADAAEIVFVDELPENSQDNQQDDLQEISQNSTQKVETPAMTEITLEEQLPQQTPSKQQIQQQPIIVLESLQPDPEPVAEQPHNAGVTKPTQVVVKQDSYLATQKRKSNTQIATTTDEKAQVSVQSQPQVQEADVKEQVQRHVQQQSPQQSQIPQSSSGITLSSNDKVFFAGDSLMQGVAPHMQRWLRKQYNIHSINLSKQSTGLSYPSFFNWPKTIEKQLAKDSRIKLLIVFLGPNDPWAFPNPAKKGGKYIKFKTPQWADVYSQRIHSILQSAKRHNVQVMWLGVPYMKKSKLNSQMLYVNSVMKNAVQGQALWLPTARLLSGNRDYYYPIVNIDGKNRKVRSKDGIHFTISGQKYIAQYIMDNISFIQ